MDSEKIIKNVDTILEKEGRVNDNLPTDPLELLEKFVLPGLKNSKDTLKSIYSFKSRERGGFFGKIKSKIQNKLINTVINVIERQSSQQQKFNDLTFKAIEMLVEEKKREVGDEK